MRRRILIPTLRKPRFTPSEQEKKDLASMLSHLGSSKAQVKQLVETLNGKDVFTFQDCVKTLLMALRKG